MSITTTSKQTTSPDGLDEDVRENVVGVRVRGHWPRTCVGLSGMSDDARQLLGKSGEDLACDELRRRGYAILERRYRTRVGEIDIVARDGATTVFVEVKARSGDDFGGGAEAVTAWKQRRVAQMAADYVSRRRLHDRPCRFDVVIVDCSAGRPQVEVFPNAFEAPF